MKILHINFSDKGGGAEDFVFDFVEDNHDFCKLLVKKKKTKSGNVIEFPKNFFDKIIYLFDGFLYLMGSKKNIRSIFSISDQSNSTYTKLKSLDCYREADIIHLHNIHGGFFDIKALLNIASEKYIVWSLHDMWAMTGGEVFTYENQNYRTGIEPSEYKNDYPLYNPLFDRRRLFSSLKKEIYKKIAERIIFVPGSKWLAECFSQSYLSNDKLKVQVINEGIDVSVFANRKKRDWLVPRVLIINSKNPLKGSGIFKKMLPFIYEDYELYVIGEDLNFNLGAKVTYLPYQKSKKELSDLFNHVDIMVFPSKSENFPLTISSAIASGVCVLGSNIGGIPEQLMERNELLFNIDNPEEMTAKLTELLKNIKQTRKFGLELSEFALEKLDKRKMYKEYFTLYAQLIKS